VGSASQPTVGVHITTRKILDAEGRLTHEINCPQVLTAWERVYRLLRDAFPPAHYHRGRGLTKFTQSQDAIRAHFSDGEIIEADLLVGADGIRSTVRQQCSPDVTPRYAGYSAWRALIAERAFPADVHRELFEYMTFGLPPGEQFLGYPWPVPTTTCVPATAVHNVVVSAGGRGDQIKVAAHGRSRRDARDSIPPPLIPRQASRKCAPMPSAWLRRSSGKSCG
jgi:2-polyprenyl-6-methoxyphenol hydroxylase-like FAD-dependent oxidoreductase